MKNETFSPTADSKPRTIVNFPCENRSDSRPQGEVMNFPYIEKVDAAIPDKAPHKTWVYSGGIQSPIHYVMPEYCGNKVGL